MFLEYSKSVLDVKHNKIIITSEINRMFLEYSKSVLDVKHNKIIITSEINRNENQRI